jgi:bifunctional non-homologous end joining protein LigD
VGHEEAENRHGWCTSGRAVRAALPEAQAPQLCATAEEPPSGEQWISEIKIDGYRLIASADPGKACLLTRTGLDWTERLPVISRAIGQLPMHAAMLDGELIRVGQDASAAR